MAVANSAKSKAAAKPATSNGVTKSKSQMHRRSRTGCFTCRLRRKKCDEASGLCSACKHLGLTCEYKRPMWWANGEARRKYKEDIKTSIKRKKLSEKASSHTIQTSSIGSPPGLSHSLPTSATFSTDPLDRTRSGSIESHFSYNFNSPPPVIADLPGPAFTPLHSDLFANGTFPTAPYEVDIKTERQMFVNDIPTLKESTTSTFSTFHTPPPPGTILPSFPFEGEWTEQFFQERRESLTEETFNTNVFDFAHGPATTTRQVAIELDEGDQRLLDHFIQFVLPTIFPILESNQHCSVGSDLILPALQNNPGYLHCCLSIAAQHFKSAMNVQDENLDQDIMRHRYATISALCEALNKDENHQQILEAALGLIFFQCAVGRPDDCLPDIAWHQHFQAAASLVQKLDLPRLVTERHDDLTNAGAAPPQTPFNMTLTAWIDILGSTMQGRPPVFAHTYRDKNLSPPEHKSLGLRELMGCDDGVMYLISEIACIEALKRDGLDHMTLCNHVHSVGELINATEAAEGAAAPRPPFNANGTLSPRQLSRNITAAFRVAARIYLCSLVPGFRRSSETCVNLVDRLTAVLASGIPSGAAGFDKSLAWVYLVGGALSTPQSPFRAFFESRVAELGDAANIGALGRVASLLTELWAHNDALAAQHEQAVAAGAAAARAAGPSASPDPAVQAAAEQEPAYLHWRELMQAKGWEYLLI